MSMMFSDVKDSIISTYVPKPNEFLKLPLGVRESGDITPALLYRGSIKQHALIIGDVGTGKTMCLTFAITALHHMYGSDIKIHYIDGSVSEYLQWKRGHGSHLLRAGYLTNVVDSDELREFLYRLVVEISRSRKRTLIVFDGIQHLVDHRADVQVLLQLLLEIAPLHNAHVVCTMRGNINCACYDLMKDCAVVGVTSTQKYISEKVLGNSLGCNSVRGYGDMVVRLGEECSILQVPETHVPFDLE